METLRADVEKFKVTQQTVLKNGQILHKISLFKYSQVWFNNGIC